MGRVSCGAMGTGKKIVSSSCFMTMCSWTLEGDTNADNHWHGRGTMARPGGARYRGLVRGGSVPLPGAGWDGPSLINSMCAS